MSSLQNPLKAALRLKVKKTLCELSAESKKVQSDKITKKILDSNEFKQSQRISIYLSLANEVNTQNILEEMFRQNKEVFVPSYSGNQMVMLKILNMQDFTSLPLTKWNIRQPNNDGIRENAFDGNGLDMILMPGVAFSPKGARLGHGMGYYDKFLHEYFTKHPHRKSNDKTILWGLAFKEQIFDEIPINDMDVLLHQIITE